jgi:hypothetical protein
MAWIRKQDILPGKMDKKKLSDAGMALVLIMLLAGLFSRNVLFYKIAIPVLLLNMIIPQIYYPFAWIWYSLSNFLAIFVSRMLLSVIYLVLVVPIGLFRKLTGNDNLNLRKFKKGQKSVMKLREYTFLPEDLPRPY